MGKRGQGEGSIRQRQDGLWEARYSVGTGKDGKQIRKRNNVVVISFHKRNKPINYIFR